MFVDETDQWIYFWNKGNETERDFLLAYIAELFISEADGKENTELPFVDAEDWLREKNNFKIQN